MAVVINEVTLTLVDVLRTHGGLGPDWAVPGSLEADATLAPDKVHVCAYSIEEHPHLRNQPPVLTEEGYGRAPLGLRLLYAFTSLGSDPLETQARLARAAQVFHSTPLLGPGDLRPALRPLVERLTVRMAGPTAEERSALWTAFGRPMRLALYYQVDALFIAALGQRTDGAVAAHHIEFRQVGE